jgi:hypothetical protein
LFPELFTTQLLSCVESTRPGHAARKLADFTPQFLDFFIDMAGVQSRKVAMKTT